MGIPQDVGKGLDLFKSLVFSPLIDTFLGAYIAPVLAIPIIGPLVRDIIQYIGGLFYDWAAGVIRWETIIFMDTEHYKAYADASLSLKSIALAKGLNSPEYKAAHDKEKLALKKFGQFNVVQPGLVSPPK